MPDAVPASRISARFYVDVARDTLSVVIIDSSTDQCVTFDIPMDAVPTVADGLRDVVDANPDSFPDVIASEFIPGEPIDR